MAIKLPSKLPSPYTLKDWLELGYDQDPKFTKNHKLLGKVLIELKRTKPPTAAAFQEFTECTAHAIKRIRKIIKAPELPGPVLEFCQPFLKLLLKWQKGAVRAQDILMEEDGETAGAAASLGKNLAQALRRAEVCLNGYVNLAGVIQKRRKELDTLGKIIKSGAASPKVDTLIKGLRGGALLKPLEIDYKKCADLRNTLPDDKALRAARQVAEAGGNADLPKQISAFSAAAAKIDKIAPQIEKSMDECGRAVEAILKVHDSK